MISLDMHRPLCRLLLCKGTTCGLNDKLPTEELESAWKEEGLHATVSMKITTCQDACEHANVARLFVEGSVEWFGGLEREHYHALLEWSRACHRAAALLPRPVELERRRFNPSA